MLRDSFLRRTPVRLALAITLLVVVAYLLAAATTYGLMRSELMRRQDQRINDIFALISANTDQGSPPDLVEAVNAQIEAARDNSGVYQLRGPHGAVLAGNIPPVTLPLGWSDQNPSVFGRSGDVPFRVRVGRIGADELLVGLDYSDVDALRETIQTAMLWSSLFALLAAIGGGGFIAMRVRRRLAVVKRTLDRVADGDLAARLPLSAADDDIDRVSRQVNGTLARLATVVDGMRQVSANIAHDLRTPLNRLRMRVSEALEAVERGEDPRAVLEAALQESDAIGDTFSALLRIAQIEAGARRERFAAVDLSNLLASVVEVYEDVAEDAGMVLVSSGLDRPAWVRGDAELLVQCVANLIENSIRHCPAGTTIRASLERSGQQIIVLVADDGPGIPEEERSFVLQRLYRLQRSRTTPGSGLGLSLVRAVAELHDADLRLDDAAPGLAVRIVFRPSPQS
ncbi:sensor histidine kinase [Solirhodobacter olei]|uniref:sensor histidine kinase n=1 Tax=Solirhodobacter olei TaxID=2493082 RepID=UPI000FD89D6E|nr:ATP-binding protein [Solirhodobacter olei]